MPACREVFVLVPDLISALCLNKKCMNMFLAMEPFDRLLRVLLMPSYVSALRKRKRNADSEIVLCYVLSVMFSPASTWISCNEMPKGAPITRCRCCV